MVTQQEVLALLSEGESYESAGWVLRIPPGQAYLIATGLPADGSDDLSPEDKRRPGIRYGSTQTLVNPPVHPGSRADEALSFLKRRAGSDAALRDAARRREATPPELQLPEEDEARYDVLDVLGRDHGRVKYLLEQLKAIPAFSESQDDSHAEQRESVLDMIVAALSPHEAAEEALFWPAVRQWLGERGAELAGRAIAQEQEGKETLAELEKLTATNIRFDELVTTLETQLRRHVALEDLVFLEMRAATEAEDRVALGKKVVAAERHGPTHPHPRAGSSRAAQRLGPVVATIDKTKDAVTGRPATRKGQSADELADEAS